MSRKLLAFILAASLAIPAFATRNREALERFKLAQLRVSSISLKGSGPCDRVSASIVDPDGYHYLIFLGSYVGEADGRVQSITAKGIEIEQIVPDGKGSFKQIKIFMKKPEGIRVE